MAKSKIHKQDNNKQKIINKPTETEKFEKFEKVKCQPCFLSLKQNIWTQNFKTTRIPEHSNTSTVYVCHPLVYTTPGVE